MSRKIFEQEQIARAADLKLGVLSADAIEIVTGDAESKAVADALIAILAHPSAHASFCPPPAGHRSMRLARRPEGHHTQPTAIETPILNMTLPATLAATVAK